MSRLPFLRARIGPAPAGSGGRCRTFLFPVLSIAMLVACAASSSPPGATSAPERGVVLLRTYYIVLQPDANLGPAHPPVDKFIDAGSLPGGLDGPEQLAALSKRFTLEDLGFQFSDAVPIEPGGDATLKLAFGELIQVRVEELKRAGGGALTARFVFTYGQREFYRRLLPFPPGSVLLFAGHIDASLPILSVISIEIRLFGPDQEPERTEFLAQAGRDRRAFAPPPPVQRDSEPYLPGVGDVTMPVLISSQRPVYPEAAKPDKLEGQVIVEIVVDREGNATNPRILTSSDPIFEPSAFEAAKTYRYRPATKNGEPVAVTMNLIMAYKFSIRTAP